MGCVTLRLWEDIAAVEALDTALIYQETVKKLVEMGLLRGQQTVEIYQVTGGFLGAISSNF